MSKCNISECFVTVCSGFVLEQWSLANCFEDYICNMIYINHICPSLYVLLQLELHSY
jgi:hypothetical protein